ncbi:hypothetical protein RF11_00013 [Thelohanellus kitauei]|uniref:Uncharacterized protein n=1 Tax=Thelohanellus kitauei TaxID=669202 RepID=A0A0C2J893_THEKT|nr:hypothetical protein RF11_00013 [Thelohanellus kitauei]
MSIKSLLLADNETSLLKMCSHPSYSRTDMRLKRVQVCLPLCSQKNKELFLAKTCITSYLKPENYHLALQKMVEGIEKVKVNLGSFCVCSSSMNETSVGKFLITAPYLLKSNILRSR